MAVIWSVYEFGTDGEGAERFGDSVAALQHKWHRESVTKKRYAIRPEYTGEPITEQRA